MKKKKRLDSDMPQGSLTEVPDFLPSPEELAKARTTVVVTIGLDKKTVEYFKRIAAKKGGRYQKMMREVLARYADYYKDSAA